MNSKVYWKVRYVILKMIFEVKKFLQAVDDVINGHLEYISFRGIVAKYLLKGVIKASLFELIVLWLEGIIGSFIEIPMIDNTVFPAVIIGEIGVAGVILGLYCSSITAIYSSKYANAPQNIARAFRSDRLTRKCMSKIMDYFNFCLVLLVVALYKDQIGWLSLTLSAIFGGVVIVTYAIAGNKSYQLSDVFCLVDDSNRVLYRIITKELEQFWGITDSSFQHYYLKKAENQIDLLKDIQRFGSQDKRSDNSTMLDFMRKNLMLVGLYWENKKKINRSSAWFRNKTRYTKWHLTGDMESSLAINTGTPLRPKEEHDYWWFENELFSIIKACVKVLFEEHDYQSLFSFYNDMNHLCKIAIENRCPIMNYKEINNNRMLSLGNNSSDAEMYFKRLLESLNIPYLLEFSFRGFVTEKGFNYRYDFAIFPRTLGEDFSLPINPEFILCIFEIDGNGHYLREDWKKTDEIKETFLRSKEIPLIRLEYLEVILNETLLSGFLKAIYFEDAELYDIRSHKDFIRYTPLARQ